MPVIKSAAKRARQSEKRRQQNTQTKKELKISTRELEAAVASNDAKQSKKLLNSVISQYDKAVKKNLIHKNKAARKKSYYANLVKGSGKKPAAKKAPAAKK